METLAAEDMATLKPAAYFLYVVADRALFGSLDGRDKVNAGEFGVSVPWASIDQAADDVPLLPRHRLRENALSHGAEAAAGVTWQRTETDNTTGRFGARRVRSADDLELIDDLQNGELKLFDCLEAVRLDAHDVGGFVVIVERVPDAGHRVAYRRRS